MFDRYFGQCRSAFTANTYFRLPLALHLYNLTHAASVRVEINPNRAYVVIKNDENYMNPLSFLARISGETTDDSSYVIGNYKSDKLCKTLLKLSDIITPNNDDPLGPTTKATLLANSKHLLGRVLSPTKDDLPSFPFTPPAELSDSNNHNGTLSPVPVQNNVNSEKDGTVPSVVDGAGDDGHNEANQNGTLDRSEAVEDGRCNGDMTMTNGSSSSNTPPALTDTQRNNQNNERVNSDDEEIQTLPYNPLDLNKANVSTGSSSCCTVFGLSFNFPHFVLFSEQLHSTFYANGGMIFLLCKYFPWLSFTLYLSHYFIAAGLYDVCCFTLFGFSCFVFCFTFILEIDFTAQRNERTGTALIRTAQGIARR